MNSNILTVQPAGICKIVTWSDYYFISLRKSNSIWQGFDYAAIGLRGMGPYIQELLLAINIFERSKFYIWLRVRYPKREYIQTITGIRSLKFRWLILKSHFQSIFLNETVYIFMKISLMFVSRGPFGSDLALV